jgi:hypothetical protein
VLICRSEGAWIEKRERKRKDVVTMPRKPTDQEAVRKTSEGIERKCAPQQEEVVNADSTEYEQPIIPECAEVKPAPQKGTHSKWGIVGIIILAVLTLSSGYSFGTEAGYDEGYHAGYDEGYDAGYDEGYEEGYDAAYYTGYDVGYSDGESYVYGEIGDEYRFLHKYAVVVTTAGKKYHHYGCYHIEDRQFYIYNIAAAEAKGYTPCLDCIEESEYE